MSNFFSVDGYWKDDQTEFEGYIISEDSNVTDEEDEDIFFYGMNESDIQKAIADGEDSELEFVITSYEICM